MASAKIQNAISTVLGSRMALPVATALAKAGLRGLGVNVGYTFDRSGEAWLLKRLFAALPGSVCLDVGANVGNFALRARACGASLVVAFEPVPETFRLLEKAVRDDKGIRPYCSAVGEIEGVASFFVPLRAEDSEQASREISITLIDPQQAQKIEVPMTTVDDIRKHQGVGFDVIKVDVEGYELEVLKGATETIKSFPPRLIQFEFNSHHGHRKQTMQDFADLLPEYRFYRLATGSLRPLIVSHYLSTLYALQNIVCIHKSADTVLKALGAS